MVFGQPVPKVAEVKEPQKETPDVKGQTSQKQKKLQKEKTAAEEKLENRYPSISQSKEAAVSLLFFSLHPLHHPPPPLPSCFRESSLQNADEAEQGQTTTVKKKKRKAPEADGENEVERWVIKRQKLRAQKQEEALKKNKTVFVGNLPVSCTKKVSDLCVFFFFFFLDNKLKEVTTECFHGFFFRPCGVSSRIKDPSSPSGFALW